MELLGIGIDFAINFVKQILKMTQHYFLRNNGLFTFPDWVKKNPL